MGNIFDNIRRPAQNPAFILLIITQILAASCHAQKSQDKDMITYHTAKVMEHADQDYIEVVFLESARFYRLPKKTKGYEDFLKLLKEAEKKQSAVKIKLTVPNGDVIEKVEKATP